jgi:hypothetical protein
MRAERVTISEPSPRRAPGRTPSPGGVLLRRRSEDWGGVPRDDSEDPVFAAQRVALATASAILETQYATTAAHSDDVVSLSEAIAERLGVQGKERASLLAAAALHDIGKVTIPREVVDKPGPLDSCEWEIVRRHTLAGERIVRSVPQMNEVAALVRSSHERWDGLGYPDGLAGDDIPLSSRIVFCADTFHAIRCDRPYRRGRSAHKALEEVRRNAGTQFDPRVVEALEDAAQRLRTSSIERVRALSGGIRSRRAALLLLVLALGGSAAAATGVGPVPKLFADQAAPPPVDCAPGCQPADLGRLGRPFDGAAAASGGAVSFAARHPGRRHHHPARGDGSGAPAPGSGDGAAGPSAGSGGTNHSSRGGAGHGHKAPRSHTPTRTRTGRPASPGRSGEAPGRVKQHGKPPKTGAPGRSEYAPGKPDEPPSQRGSGHQKDR